MKEIYLDHAASTPVDPKVLAAMGPYFTDIYGNAQALHRFGQKASRAVFESRQKIAKAIGADYEEIIFTGSATEANNLAIRGLVGGASVGRRSLKPRIIISAIEHESVLNTCADLKSEAETIIIPVDKEGVIDLVKLEAAINDRAVLVSVMHANNEIGVIQPIRQISEIIQRHRSKNKTSFPYFHTDAAQSFQYLDCNVQKLGVDLMTLSAHKIYGPKGIGALYVNKTVSPLMKPVITGGKQENGLRSGTENVPLMVGFAKAVELAGVLRTRESKRVAELRNYFLAKIQKSLEKKRVLLNGSMTERLPNNLNLYFPGHKAHDLLIRLDLVGIAVSPGAACSTRVSKASYVLEAMGFSADRASGSLRFSLGRQTTKKDIDSVISAIIKIV